MYFMCIVLKLILAMINDGLIMKTSKPLREM